MPISCPAIAQAPVATGAQIRQIGAHAKTPSCHQLRVHRRFYARASTVDRRRSVTCWRTTVIALEANDSLENLADDRPAGALEARHPRCPRAAE